jgi:hypothetical protein
MSGMEPILSPPPPPPSSSSFQQQSDIHGFSGGPNGENKEKDMAEAIERLAAVLKTSAEPDIETSRQVRDVQDQITQMLEEDRDDDYDDNDSDFMDEDGAYMMGYDGYPMPPPSDRPQHSTEMVTTMRGAPHTELPHYPTPWELWKKAHESTELPREPPVLSETEWQRLVDRLNDSSKTKQISLMRKQHKYIATELAGLNFKPRINPLSRDMAAENLRLYEGDRLQHVVKSKAEKIAKARHQLQKAEIDKCTFQPNLTKKAQKKTRDVEDLMLYGEIKKQRLFQRRQYIQDLQDRELTFKPHVNRKSERLVAKMASEGRLRPTGGRRGYTGTNEDPGHGEDTFSPKINKRSKSVKLNGQVYERLYESAFKANQDKAELQNKYINKHIRGGVIVSPNKNNRNRNKRDDNLYGRINVVRYQPKHDFILRRFGATAVV